MLHVVNIIFISVAAAIFWSFLKVVYNVWFHPLRKYPGPKLWVASRLAWASSFQSGHFHHRLAELHAKYGPVVRVAPDELSYIDAGAWRDIYENRNIGKNRTWASEEEKTGPISIVSTDEATHLRNKRALTGAFTEHAIAEHASILEGLIGLMAQNFEKAIEQNQGSATFNLVDWFNFLTFDISGALSFGESFGSVENGKAHPWVEISCSFGKGVALMATINFFDPINKLLKYAIPTKLIEKMNYHKALTHERLMQRLAMDNKSKVQDYIGSIEAYNADKGEIKMSEKEMETNMTVLIFAGSETTSTASACILNELLRNPAALETVTEEIRSTFQSEDEITVPNVHKLEYLNAVIQEGLRVGPPAPIGVPRLTPREGATICGEYVPGGTFVYVSQYPAFRSPINFTRPESFVPERFLPNSPFPNDRMEAFEPFLLGRHKCIGQKLAQTIMRLTLAKLLYKFDISAVQELQDFGEQDTYIFWDKKPLQVELRLRKE